jgi:hypothetical protein
LGVGLAALDVSEGRLDAVQWDLIPTHEMPISTCSFRKAPLGNVLLCRASQISPALALHVVPLLIATVPL